MGGAGEGYRDPERRKKLRRESDRQAQAAHDRRGPQVSTKEFATNRRQVIRSYCEALLTPLESPDNKGRRKTAGSPFECRLLELSLGGAAVVSPMALEPGQDCRVELSLHDGRRVHAVAQVRWVKPIEKRPNDRALGLQFTQLDPSQRNQLRDYLSVLDATFGLEA